MNYGSAAQKNITEFSDAALKTVRTKDLGEVGQQLGNLVVELKGFNYEPEEKKGFLGLFKKSAQNPRRCPFSRSRSHCRSRRSGRCSRERPSVFPARRV